MKSSIKSCKKLANLRKKERIMDIFSLFTLCGGLAFFLYGMNVMSIATDPSNLFEDEKGIYVLGDKFKESLKDGVVQYEGEAGVFSWPANYKQRGRKWEREAVVHCFDTGGNPVFSGPCGIRIQGRATRFQMPKNLNVYARKQYGSDSDSHPPPDFKRFRYRFLYDIRTFYNWSSCIRILSGKVL